MCKSDWIKLIVTRLELRGVEGGNVCLKYDEVGFSSTGVCRER